MRQRWTHMIWMVWLVAGCATDSQSPTAEEDTGVDNLCLVDGYDSLGLGTVDFAFDGNPRRSCATGTIVLPKEGVMVSAGAEREDGTGWVIQIHSGDRPCDEGGECSILFTHMEGTTPVCIQMASNDPEFPIGSLDITIDEVGEEYVTGTFSGTVIGDSERVGMGCGYDSEITDGVFHSAVAPLVR